jgi:hypothetical protein
LYTWQGGVSHKKVSRAQAALHVDVQEGKVVLTVLGKNGMLFRASDQTPFAALAKGQKVALQDQSEFSLLASQGVGPTVHHPTKPNGVTAVHIGYQQLKTKTSTTTSIS